MNASNILSAGFPIDEVSLACANEKSVRQGHLSTLQFWWARRPLAVCRATTLLALCPPPARLHEHPALLARLEAAVPGTHDPKDLLLQFAGRASWWKEAEDGPLLRLARDLVMAGRREPPLVFDPFGGGGSVPVEALRLGARAACGELSPVAHAALRVAVEDLPKHGSALVDAFVAAAKKVERRLAAATDGIYGAAATLPLAWFWCRTFACPNCRGEGLLLRSRHLAKKPRRVCIVTTRDTATNRAIIEVVNEATSTMMAAAETGTAGARGATCLLCDHHIPNTYLQAEGMAGRLGERLLAVLEVHAGQRRYRAATPHDEALAKEATLRQIPDRVLTAVPNAAFDLNGVRHIWAMQYGVRTTGDLYSKRQGVALLELFETIQEVLRSGVQDGSLPEPLAGPVASLLCLTFNRVVMYHNRHVWWQANGEFPANIFVRQAISMVWDFVEIPVNSEGAAGWASAVSWMRKAAAHLARLPACGSAWRGDAAESPLEAGSVDLVLTDPPYYDSITYAHLADVFYVWMRPLLRGFYPDAFPDAVGPRAEEAIVDRKHKEAPSPKSGAHFSRKMRQAFRECHRVLSANGLFVTMYGHKQAAAWQAFLGPLIEAGFEPLASWPVHTERKVKFKHGTIGALSTSCLIVCRKVEVGRGPRPELSWGDFEGVLGARLIPLVLTYRRARIVGADLTAALLAPAVAEFTRWRVVDGSRPSTLGRLFEALPRITQACELAATRDSFFREDERLLDELAMPNGSSPTENGRHLDAAVDYAGLLAEGRVAQADALCGGLPPESRNLFEGFLHAIASGIAPDVRLTRGAAAGIARIAMHARTPGQ